MFFSLLKVIVKVYCSPLWVSFSLSLSYSIGVGRHPFAGSYQRRSNSFLAGGGLLCSAEWHCWQKCLVSKTVLACFLGCIFGGREKECVALSFGVYNKLFCDGACNYSLINVDIYVIIMNVWIFLLTSEENWEFFLKMHLEWRCEYLKEKWNPHENKDYKWAFFLSAQLASTHPFLPACQDSPLPPSLLYRTHPFPFACVSLPVTSHSLCLSRDLTTREKVETLHRLCHWRLELDDIGDLLRVW